MKSNYKPGTHAGELEEESLEEIWDHLYSDEVEEPKIPTFDDATLQFLQDVNGVVPINASIKGLRIVRFLNFSNYYFPGNAAIADWHVVKNRDWIADRLDPLVIPVAELAHGDYLCLDFSAGGSPRFLRWMHERSQPGRPAYQLLAEDFAAFWAAIEQE